MAADLGVVMGGRECIVRVSFSSLGLNLLLMCTHSLLSAVVKRVCLRSIPGNRFDLVAGRSMSKKIPHHCQSYGQ